MTHSNKPSRIGNGFEFQGLTVYDPGSDTFYVPFVSDDGRVGYRVGSTKDNDGRETFIYLNPSSNSTKTPDDPNVFVYEGIENDPAEDASIVFVQPVSLIA